MFEALMARAGAAAERRAEARAKALAVGLDRALPGDVAVSAVPEGARLEGRSLRARLALDPALKWVIAGLIR